MHVAAARIEGAHGKPGRSRGIFGYEATLVRLDIGYEAALVRLDRSRKYNSVCPIGFSLIDTPRSTPLSSNLQPSTSRRTDARLSRLLDAVVF